MRDKKQNRLLDLLRNYISSSSSGDSDKALLAQFKKDYRKGIKKTKPHKEYGGVGGIFSGLVESDEELERYKPGEIIAIANAMLNEGQKEGDLYSAITGAKLYEKIGAVGDSVRRKLIIAHNNFLEKEVILTIKISGIMKDK